MSDRGDGLWSPSCVGNAALFACRPVDLDRGLFGPAAGAGFRIGVPSPGGVTPRRPSRCADERRLRKSQCRPSHPRDVGNGSRAQGFERSTLTAAESAAVGASVPFGHATPDAVGFTHRERVIAALRKHGAGPANPPRLRLAPVAGVAALIVR